MIKTYWQYKNGRVHRIRTLASLSRVVRAWILDKVLRVWDRQFASWVYYSR